jgi:hypothetical protein
MIILCLENICNVTINKINLKNVFSGQVSFQNEKDLKKDIF